MTTTVILCALAWYASVGLALALAFTVATLSDGLPGEVTPWTEWLILAGLVVGWLPLLLYVTFGLIVCRYVRCKEAPQLGLDLDAPK